MKVMKGGFVVRRYAFETISLGDRAFAFRWSEPLPAALLAARAAAVSALGLPWLLESAAASGTIAFYLKPSCSSIEEAAAELIRLWDGIREEAAAEPRRVELPVVYGGEFGPDLGACASRAGMTEARFAELHSSAVYTVEMMGFAPGFPYLSGLDDRLEQPRRPNPRMRVPAGSVAVAGNRTGVYPNESPGGWQIIGRTAVPLFRPEEKEPFPLRPGDQVSFVPAAELSTPGEDEDKDMDKSPWAPANPALKVLKPGLLTTVQDAGRAGWRRYGVSAGGAMDDRAMRTANLLVGNDEEDAVLELTMIGGSYAVERDLLIAVCGADLSPQADGSPVPMNRPVFVAAGSELTFGKARFGCRAYMAVAGGIDAPAVLGSRSADPRARIGGGSGGRALAAGDAIGAAAASPRSTALLESLRARAEADGKPARLSAVSWHAADDARSAAWPGGEGFTLRVVPGEEWEEFTEASRERLLSTAYRVEASSDRMGLRLSGEPLLREGGSELVSHGVVPGTIQVPPDGNPIVLGAGCQPTGGYPKIAHVIGADWPLLAQAAPGCRLAFEAVTLREAELAWERTLRERALLKAGIGLRLAQAASKGGTK
ncbi:hypothetical protein B1A99_14580 [Cohnella sp. CIP 111063]|nr:hypothetical protein B1A99_14580 [Cohnella sp. CIP 111063]